MSNLKVPEESYYTKNHEWLSVDENIVTVGITEYAAHNLGEIVYVDLPEEGDRISINSFFSSLESPKKIMDLVGAFGGTILEVNSRIYDNPGLINDDPYGEGWIFIAEMENEKDLAQLMRAPQYKTYISQLSAPENIT